MAILGMEGFDHYPDGISNTGLASVRDYTFSSAHEIGIKSSPATRHGTGKYLNVFDDGYFQVMLGDTITDTIYISYAVRPYNMATNGRNIGWFTTTGTTDRGYLWLGDDGALSYHNGANTLLVGKSTQVMTDETWHWVELKVRFHDTLGTVEVWVDGVQWLLGSTLDTMYLADTTPLIDKFILRSNGYALNETHYDDLVWQDDGGGFLGDSRIETFMPSTDSSSAWSQTGAGSNAADISAIPVDDANYVYTSTVNDSDIYNFTTLTEEKAIHAVGISTRAKIGSAGDSRSFENRTISGAQQQGGTEHALNSEWSNYSDVYEDNGSVPWTKTLFDGAQFGVKLIS